MAAKVLQNIPFLGKDRKAGDIITDDELGLLTVQTRDALISQGIIEVEGFKMAGAPLGMTAADHEALSSLRASFDNFREATEKSMGDLHKKLDAAMGVKPKAKRTKK